jgi:hypothetical protein
LSNVIKPGFSDHAVYQKHSMINWGHILRMVLRHGPIDSTMNLVRYPWLLDLLKVNGLLKRLVEGRIGEYRKSVALLISLITKQVIGLIDGLLHEDSDRLVMHQAMVSPEIVLAMGLNPWPFDSLAILLPTLNPGAVEKYIDACENDGVPPDVCSFVKTPIGLALTKDIPVVNAPLISSDVACDGQMIGFQLIGRELNAPSFQVDVPHHFKSEKAVDYYVQQLKDMIAFLEEHTPGRMDWDRLKHIMEKRNRMQELALEIWDMLRHKPAPLAAEAVYLSHVWTFAVAPGQDSSVEFWEKLSRMCKKNLDAGVAAVPGEKYRTLLWNTWTMHAVDLYVWAEKRYGVTLLMDMMTYSDLPYVDTSNPDSMLKSLARIHMNGPMARHTRGPLENYLDDIYHLHETLDLDMLWFSEHIGCKNASATLGVVREKCREWGLPLMVLDNDIMDPRLQDGEGIKGQVDRFMKNIMKAERLDA